MELTELKAAVGQVRGEYAFSERRACGLVLLAVSSYRYQSRRSDAGLRARLVELAREKPRWGYRRLHALLERRGEAVNHKRVHRVYREAGLGIRRKTRKRLQRSGPAPRVLTGRNQEWALDFVHDTVESGRAIRVLSVVDVYTRECLALEVDTSFASRRVTRVLEANRGGTGSAGSDSLRQRPGTDQSSFSGVVCGAEDRDAAHPAGTADAERARGEFSRQTTGRMFASELVWESVRGAAEDRGVAERVQRGAPAQQLGVSDAGGVCARASGESGSGCGKDGGCAPLENAARFPLSHSHGGDGLSTS